MISTVDETIDRLIREGILSGKIRRLRDAKGTSEGQVCLLGDSGTALYVLKRDEARSTREAALFLRRYSHSPLLPALRWMDPDGHYLLYDYVEGTTHVNRGRKADWMAKLVRGLYNLYEREHSFEGFGSSDDPCGSWQEFNRRTLAFARDRIGNVLPPDDHAAMERLWESGLRDWASGERYALHGDTGVHNFVFCRGELAGIIDPSPAAGPLLYDFTYAFCSSPDDLDTETLLGASALLREGHVEADELIRETAFQLYARIAICLIHHPDDLPEYLKAWPYWRDQAMQAGN